MKKLFPLLLPALLGFVASLSYSAAADYVDVPSSFSEAAIQSPFGQGLRD